MLPVLSQTVQGRCAIQETNAEDQMVPGETYTVSVHCSHSEDAIREEGRDSTMWPNRPNLVSRQEGHSQDSKVTLSPRICQHQRYHVLCLCMDVASWLQAKLVQKLGWPVWQHVTQRSFVEAILEKWSKNAAKVKSRDNWLWSVTLTENSDHHIYISTRMNCKIAKRMGF